MKHSFESLNPFKLKLQLAISPCPNDTFIFDALINKKIDSEGLELEVILEDIQQLNERAIRNSTDLIKVSAGVLPLIWNDFMILPSGGAMGYGSGPLVITRPALKGKTPSEDDYVVALPGENTTAHFLFEMAFPGVKQKRFRLFSLIEEDVLNGSADFGVIIHENRFTYKEKGLCLVADLGKSWEEKTRLPIPLGVIAARRNIPIPLLKKVNQLIQKSLAHAWENASSSLPEFVTSNAKEMSQQVMRSHIELYVTNFSMDMGQEGKEAIVKMLQALTGSHNPERGIPNNLFLS
jgi:1,4-dihydroxy-6-naphthoate synthase